MVEYTRWVSIVFEVAPDDLAASEVMEWAAAEWNHVPELRQATVREAREHAQSRV